MKIHRRHALGLLGAAVAGSAAASSPAVPDEPGPPFAWGVASGDPLTDRVIIWTRFAGALAWEVAEDADFRRIVRRGAATPRAERDFTVKVDVTGLKPARDYHYRFRALNGGEVSPVGRTRTLPAGPTEKVVLAFATCALIPAGYFNAYQAIADLPRVDAVVHLGDYIYEYGAQPDAYGMSAWTPPERAPQPPNDCVTLQDYRTRLAQYRSDPQLQAAHARAPWIVVWDDHESANDSWRAGAQNHRPDEGDWSTRKAAAVKAYYEWMPIREPADGGLAIWRSFDFGDLASLFMLETRLTGRDQQLTYGPLLKDPSPTASADFRRRLDDPARRMMSAGQEAWLEAGMARSVRSGRPWQVLGNQVVMARISPPPIRRQVGQAALDAALTGKSAYAKQNVGGFDAVSGLGLPYLLDSWDGYPADRQRVLDLLGRAKANPIVVSGDSHAFWVNTVYDRPVAGRLAAVEFGATAITSPGLGDDLPGVPVGEAFAKHNREVRFNDPKAKGFVLLTLTHASAQAELMAVTSVTSRQFETETLKRYRVRRGKAGLTLSEA